MPNKFQSLVCRASFVLSIALLAGCGSQTLMPMGLGHSAAMPGDFGVMGVPSSSQFQTVQVVVTQILPEDTKGLPHQNFMVKETAPQAGQILEVNNDESFGTKVANLTVGEALTIRGVEYHDSNSSGIHWTHHASQPNDAGFIKTPDGHVYQ